MRRGWWERISALRARELVSWLVSELVGELVNGNGPGDNRHGSPAAGSPLWFVARAVQLTKSTDQPTSYPTHQLTFSYTTAVARNPGATLTFDAGVAASRPCEAIGGSFDRRRRPRPRRAAPDGRARA